MVNWLLDDAWTKKTMSAHEIRSARRPFLIIVRGLTLVLRANAKKAFLVNHPPWWLALYIYLQFSWEEKLIAPLIATPNVDKAIENKKIGKSYATGYRCNSCLQKGITILFCKQVGWSPSTNYASSLNGFKMEWTEVAGTCSRQFLVLNSLLLRLECLNKIAMSARLCNTEIVPVGHKRQVEKTDNVCQKCLLVAESP